MNTVHLNRQELQSPPATNLASPGKRPFLTASWTNLFVITYAVPPETLAPLLSPGLSLDLRDGNAFVSLVAFDFRDTKVMGVSWPGYRNFPELNLRYYVRQGQERGVVFIREIVPQRLVASMARLLYNEPYRVAPLHTSIAESAEAIRVERQLTWHGRKYHLRVTGSKPASTPHDASDEHFFLEQRWGFGVNRRGRTIVYEVCHPTWEIYPVTSWELDLDWAPCNVALAAGSAVTVSPHVQVGKITGAMASTNHNES
jgi:hypothetical protein